MKTIFEAAKEHILIAAHRGICGGNIPCNTIASYNIGLKQGADIIELDVDITSDGKLITFHPGVEKPHLGLDINLTKMTFEEVKELRFINQDDTKTQFGIHTLDEVFENLKGRCFINVDKFWENPEPIAAAIRAHGLENYAIIKGSVNEENLANIEKYAPDLMYMPIVTKPEQLETVLNRNVNCIGAEVCFGSEESFFASDEFISDMHNKGLLIWVNAIIYNYKTQLVAGHSDDYSLTVSEDGGWGWLADKGYDIIQTDWAGMCIDYLKKSGRYSR